MIYFVDLYDYITIKTRQLILEKFFHDWCWDYFMLMLIIII